MSCKELLSDNANVKMEKISFKIRCVFFFVHFSSHVVTRMNLVDFQDQVQLKA